MDRELQLTESRRPGERLLEAVAAMDRLRVGCPWDREQTHASLVRYVIEEAYEVADAVDREAWDELPDELGDLLLQVLFHSRIAEEREDGFDVDDVADALIAKMTRRHPHVFGGESVADAAEVAATWEQIKRAEREANGIFDDPRNELAAALARIPSGLPPSVSAAKVLSKIDGAGRDVEEAVAAASRACPEGAAAGEALAALYRSGADVDATLRAWVRALVAAGSAPSEQ